jgi:sulfur relay (sulfurtransferase) complex TusBCD TusD component (DsrE family)
VVLVLCLLSGPRSEAVHTVRELARAALEQGHEVRVFLAGDGTAHMQSLAPLRNAGARLVGCSADAAARGWDQPGTVGRGSFVDLGDMTSDADKVLVF